MRTLPQTINVCKHVNDNVFPYAEMFHRAAAVLNDEDYSSNVALLIGALGNTPKLTDSPYLRENAEAAIYHLRMKIGAVADL